MNQHALSVQSAQMQCFASVILDLYENLPHDHTQQLSLPTLP